MTGTIQIMVNVRVQNELDLFMEDSDRAEDPCWKSLLNDILDAVVDKNGSVVVNLSRAQSELLWVVADRMVWSNVDEAQEDGNAQRDMVSGKKLKTALWHKWAYRGLPLFHDLSD